MASLGDSLDTQAFNRINHTLDRVEVSAFELDRDLAPMFRYDFVHLLLTTPLQQTTTRESLADESSTDSYGRTVREKFRIGEELHHWKARARFHPRNRPERRLQHPSNVRRTNLTNPKSLGAIPTMVEPAQSQEATALPQGNLLGGFAFGDGGDTQAGNTQIYKNYTSVTMSSTKMGQGLEIEKMDDSGDDPGLHTVIDGDTEHIDLVGTWEPNSQSPEDVPIPSQSSSEDELSQHVQLPTARIPSFTLPPETPAMAGSKRNHRGEIISSTSTKTPGTNLTSVFGKRDDNGPGISMSQMFNATQARSSPLNGALRSDPVFQRPSPNFEGYRHSSPVPATSSPIKEIRSDFSRAVTEPRETYTTMQQSQELREMRALRKEQEGRRLRSSFSGLVDDESDDDFDDVGMISIRRKRMADIKNNTRKDLVGLSASLYRSGIRDLENYRSTSKNSAYVTPSRESKKKEEVIEILDDAQSDDNDADAASDDEYDELAQDMRKHHASLEDGEGDHPLVPMTEFPPRKISINIPVDESSPLYHRKEVRAAKKIQREDDLQVAGTQQSSGATSGRQGGPPSGSAQSGPVADSQPTNQDELAQDSLPSIPRISDHTSQLMDSEIPSLSPGLQARVRKLVGTSSLPPPPSSDEAVPNTSPCVAVDQQAQSLTRHNPYNPVLEHCFDHEGYQSVVDRTVMPDHLREQRFSCTSPLTDKKREAIGTVKKCETRSSGSLIPETDPIELPSTPTHEANKENDSTTMSAVAISGVPSDPLSDAAVTSITPSKSTAPYDTARSQFSSPLETPRSSQRLQSLKNSSQLRHTRKLTDIEADPTPPGARIPVDLDEVDPWTTDDEEFDRIAKPESPARIRKRRRGNRTKQVAEMQSSQDCRLTKPTAEVCKDAHATDAAQASNGLSTQGVDQTVLKETEANRRTAIQPPVTTQTRVTANAEPHTTRSSRTIKPTSKLQDQPPKHRPKISRAIDQESHTSESARTPAFKPVPIEPEMVDLQNRSGENPTRTSENAQASLPRLEIPDTAPSEPQPRPLDGMEFDGEQRHDNPSSPTSSPLSSPPSSPIIETTEGTLTVPPNRVLALCKTGSQAYWPGVYLGPSTSCLGNYQIKFDDGSVDPNLEARHIKSLRLHVGDQVKIDLNKMRTQTYVVQGFKNEIDISKVEDPMTDVYGFQTVVLASKKRISTAGDQTLEDTVSAPLKSIYLTKTIWDHLQGRDFVPPTPQPLVQEHREQTPITATNSGPSTPLSRTRRQTNPSFRTKQTKKNARVSRASSFSPTTSGVFGNMAFALTFTQNGTEKDEIAGLVEANGGHILSDGFEELFDTTDANTGGPPGTATLILKPGYQNLGFVALLTDRHSRRKKHMQALALRFPILSSHWVRDTLRVRHPEQPVPYAPYLLPAGESATLGNAIRSLVLHAIHDPATARLATMLTAERSTAGNLLSGNAVLLVSAAAAAAAATAARPKSKQAAASSTLDTFEFLIRAMGAERVRVARSVQEREQMLRDAWDMVFVEGGEAEMARVESAVDDHVRVVDDQFVVQSLILGKLMAEE